MSFKSLSKKSAGPKPKNNNGKLIIELNKFFENEFVYVLSDKPKGSIKIGDIDSFNFDAVNLSYIINYFEDQIETMIKNNIKINFCKYIHQYVNQHFLDKSVKKIPKNEYEQLTKIEKTNYREQLTIQKNKNNIIMKELEHVKDDLFNKTNTSDTKYTTWINDQRKIIFPELLDKSLLYEDDLDIDCFKYLKHMLKMNFVLEKNMSKMFTAFPTRKQIVDKYVTFNSSALKDIFSEVYTGITNEEIWKKYFNINPKKIGIKGYSFNFQISTDGFSASINSKKKRLLKSKSLIL